MENFYISRILIDGGILCDIMYDELFEQLGLKKDKLLPYTGYDLQVFNVMVTLSCGFMELMSTFRDGRYAKTIDLQFLVVPHKSLYTCILGKPFAATLDIVASPFT